MPLSPQERSRYARQIGLPEIGMGGQQNLQQAAILIVGMGGLGASAALYLAAAGVGRLGLLDDDTVSLSNLQRQVIYDTDDAGLPKVEAASRRLLALNPEIRVEAWNEKFHSGNALRMVRDFDLVLDGTDSFHSRYLINQACRIAHKPLVHGAVAQFSGQVAVFEPDGACYRCLHPNPPEAGAALDCNQSGVLGPIVGMISMMQAMEALKRILRLGEPGDSLAGKILIWDALTVTSRLLIIPRRPACPDCDPARRALDVPQVLAPATGPCTRADGRTLSSLQLRRRLHDPLVLLDLRTEQEFETDHLPGAVHAPFPLNAELLAGIHPDSEIVVYCQSGSLSRWAQQSLHDLGFQNVAQLEGGMKSWLGAR